MFLLLVQLRARADSVEAVCQHLAALVEVAPSEPGTLAYSFYRVHDDPCLVIVHELYADRTAWEAHMASAPVLRALEAFGSLLAEPPSLTTAALAGAYGLPYCKASASAANT